jgi:hypothetical protein
VGGGGEGGRTGGTSTLDENQNENGKKETKKHFKLARQLVHLTRQRSLQHRLLRRILFHHRQRRRRQHASSPVRHQQQHRDLKLLIGPSPWSVRKVQRSAEAVLTLPLQCAPLSQSQCDICSFKSCGGTSMSELQQYHPAASIQFDLKSTSKQRVMRCVCAEQFNAGQLFEYKDNNTMVGEFGGGKRCSGGVVVVSRCSLQKNLPYISRRIFMYR